MAATADFVTVRWALTIGLLTHLPMALQRVYGGAKWTTALKLIGLGALYLLVVLVIGLPTATALAMLTF